MGYQLGVFNTSQLTIKKYFGWSEHESLTYIGVISSLMPIGGLIGALIAGPLLHSGRRFSLLMTDILSIAGVVLCLYSFHTKNVYELFAGRIVCGICSGMN